MKTKFIIGMALTMALAAPSFASSRKGLAAENISKAVETAKAQVKSGSLATNLKKVAADIESKSGGRIKSSDITAVVEKAPSDKKEAYLEAVVKMSIAKEFSEFSGTADAFLALLKNTDRVGMTTPKTLSAEEASVANEAVTKLALVMGDRAIQMENAETASYTKVAEKTADLLNKDARLTAEEALLQAIMDTHTNGDRAKAMEIIRKLKDCV